MPTALIETVGHPPLEWQFIRHAAEILIAKWNAKKRKRHRNIEEDVPPQPAKAKQRLPDVATALARPSGMAVERSSTPRGSISSPTTSLCLAVIRHPDCTSEEGCIGDPMSRLVRHVVDKDTFGDIYCEPCWRTFVYRKSSLKGVFVS